MEFEDLTEKIIGCAIEVHKTLGPGFIESIYEKALIEELHSNSLFVENQKEIVVLYKDKVIGKHRLDLLVNETIIVELKAIKKFDNIHFSIVRSYLKAMDLKHGLLLNFAGTKMEIKRVIFEIN